MKYKQVLTKNGRTQYWADGNMVSAKNIPEAILRQLEPGVELEIDVAPLPTEEPDEPEVKPENRVCFIDGNPGDYKKFLQLKTVYLCKEHQQELTTGEVVYEMRKAGILE